MRAQAIIALAASALLGGCNLVTTVEPMFRASEPRERVRDGVWAMTNEACEFDSAKPIAEWPTCVAAVMIAGDSAVTWDPEKKKRVEAQVVWTLGPPLVTQERLQLDKSDDPKLGDHIYAYSGFEVRARDAQGRAIEMEAWRVICGPPRTTPAKDGARLSSTGSSDHPFPGIKVDKNCEPESVAALRRAALASRRYEQHHLRLRWIRERDR